MKTVIVFDELPSKTDVLHPPATTTIKAEKTENFSPVIIAKSDSDEYASDKTADNFENINHPTATSAIIFEKIPKTETDEQSLWSDSESNDEPDRDPFADVKCDPNFALFANLPRDVVVQQQEPAKCTETNQTIGYLPSTSKPILPKPRASTKMVQNNSQIKFDCKLCLMNLGSENDLKAHVRLCSTTHKNRRLFCVDCNIKYVSSHGFKRHCLRVHCREIEAIRPEFYRVQLQCQFCPLKYVRREKFKIHTESHVKKLHLGTATTAQNETNLQLKLNPYKCQECSSTFGTVMNLSDHVLAKHVNHIFKCPDAKCGKIFNTKGHLNGHFRTHSDSKPFVCPEPNCGKCFKYKDSMSRHSPSHSHTKLFYCSEPNCGNVLRTEGDLEKHKQLHKSSDSDSDRSAKNRPFACPECHVTFSQNWRVTVHVKFVHRKGEPLKCPHPECGKTFKHEYTLNIHVKEFHGSGEKESFKCPHPGCNYTCKRKSYVKVHMKTHTGERPFKCTVVEGCSKTFVEFNHLKSHIREKHKKDVKK